MSDRTPSLPLVFVLLLLVGLMLVQGRCVQEDAFISFRYAANLLDGHGLVFNPGERVEGYTNFLWTVMIAGAMALGAEPAAAVHAAGIVAALLLCGVVLIVARLARPGHRWAGLVALALLAGTPGLAAEAVQGLETVWFALLVTIGVTTAARAIECDDPRRATRLSLASAMALVLAALTRPEGVGVLALTAAGAVFVSRRGGPSCRRWLGIAVVSFLMIYLPYWVLRFQYYGHPLPNTFYAKTGGGWHHLLRGLAYLGTFLLHHPVLTALSLTAAPALRGLSRPGRALPVFVISGYLGYVVLVGGDFKQTGRFILPVLPLWALLLDAGVTAVLARRDHAASRLAWGLVAVAVLNALPTTLSTLRWSRQRARDLERRTVCGEWLRDNAPPGALLAIHSVGIVPYVSGLRTIDMWGLNDLHIAHRTMPDMGRARPAGHEKIDYGYVFGRAPDLILPRGWVLVTDAPYPGLKGAMFPGVGAWDEHAAAYVERHALLPPRPGSSTPRWFNYLARLSSRE